MRAVTLKYRIYKDRLYLSISISIILHVIAIYVYYLIPTPSKEVVLRPISLGILQPKIQNQSTENTQSNDSHTESFVQKKENRKPKNQKKVIAKSVERVESAKPSDEAKVSDIQSPPSSDIDLNSLSIPEENKKFDPFMIQKPSLSQSIQRYNDNVNFDKLPSVAKEMLYKLYGTELDKMSKEQKDYLAASYFLNGRVFQETADKLGYPRLAQLLKQYGSGTVEFTLNPDGSATNIRVITTTGYESLDSRMIQIVEQSAKSLKRPPKSMVIRINGNFTLY